MVGTHSFVWVTGPRSANSHQAELLEIRDDGYLVKWSISGKEELISLESVLQQELPRRTRRRSSPSVFDASELNDDEDDMPKMPETPMLIDSRSQPREELEMEEDDYEKEEEVIVHKPPKKKKQKTNNHNPPKKSKKPNNDYNRLSITSLGPQHPSPDQFLNLFKLHKKVRNHTEARVAELLGDAYPHAGAAALVTEFFLFCHERQSCWQRRNNEENPEWSSSCILQHYNFCNVYRNLDRGTCYVRMQFAQHYLQLSRKWAEEASLQLLQGADVHKHRRNSSSSSHHPKPNKIRRREWIQKLLWTCYVYRQANQMEPFLEFGSIPVPDQLEEFLGFVGAVEEEDESQFFATTYPTPSFDDYKFHLQRLNQANGWLLKSIAGRLAQCRTVQACWEQIGKRLPGMQNYPNVAWQVLCDLMESGCLLVQPHKLDAIDWIYLAPPQQKILATCWKDKRVDDFRSLSLLKLLTEQQDEIFEAIGVDFPAWDGRPLSIKDIAHCLGQYAIYLRIQADMKRQVSTEGHRLLVSKSYLDVSKACRFCDKQTDEGLFCDACLCFYCKGCEEDSCAQAPDCWSCNPCKDLMRLQFLD